MTESNQGNLSFRGGSSADCEDFISAVNQWAFEEEKDEDDRLVARFAYSRMAGEALRFYDTLEVDVQSSWRQLRQALLAQYPPYDPKVPSPAAAGFSAVGDTRVGLIRVDVEGDSKERYLCHAVDTHGDRFNAMEDPRRALFLRLEVGGSDGIRPLRLLGSTNWLGLAWAASGARQSVDPAESYAYFSCINDTAQSSCKSTNGPKAWLVWKYCRSTGKLNVHCYEDNGREWLFTQRSGVRLTASVFRISPDRSKSD